MLTNLLFLNQIITAHSYVGPSWSLSLEFWLYCLAPALILLNARKSRWIVYASFAAYLAYTFCRSLYHLPYFAAVSCGGNIVLLAFMWVCGLRLAREKANAGPVLADIKWIFTMHILFAAAIQLISRVRHHSLAQFFTEDASSFLLQSLTLGAVYLVFGQCVLKPNVGRKRAGWARILGDISYPFYLIHFPVFIVLKTTTPVRHPAAFYLVAVMVSYLLYLAVDLYSRRRGPTETPSARPSLSVAAG